MRVKRHFVSYILKPVMLSLHLILQQRDRVFFRARRCARLYYDRQQRRISRIVKFFNYMPLHKCCHLSATTPKLFYDTLAIYCQLIWVPVFVVGSQLLVMLHHKMFLLQLFDTAAALRRRLTFTMVRRPINLYARIQKNSARVFIRQYIQIISCDCILAFTYCLRLSALAKLFSLVIIIMYR